MKKPLYWKGPSKQVARKIAMDYSSNSNYAGIFLPGIDNACVNYALYNRTITRDKPLYLIEKDQVIAEQIEGHAKRNLSRPLFHFRDADKLDITRKLDFAYLDFIGSMNERLYAWIKNQVVPNLHKNNRLTFCFNFAWRPEIPFLEYNYDKYLKNKQFVSLCQKYDYKICTYLMLFKELLPNHKVVLHNGDPFYYYCSNRIPVVVYTFTQEENEMTAVKKKLPSHDFATLIEQYPAAYASLSTNRNKWRGWMRSYTLYCSRRALETKKAIVLYARAVKARLTFLGYDTTPIK